MFEKRSNGYQTALENSIWKAFEQVSNDTRTSATNPKSSHFINEI